MMIKDNNSLVIASVEPIMTVKFEKKPESYYGFDMALTLGQSSGGVVAEVLINGNDFSPITLIGYM